MADNDTEKNTTADNPVTMEEWESYVDGLTNDEELYEIAMAAGTIKFGQKLMDEGYPATDITAIRTMLAKKLLESEAWVVPLDASTRRAFMASSSAP